MILLSREGEGLCPALLTVSLPLAHLLEQRAQSRQLSETEAGNHIALRSAPIRQSPQEDRLASLCQCYIAFAQIATRRKREQPPLREPLNIASDGRGIAM